MIADFLTDKLKFTHYYNAKLIEQCQAHEGLLPEKAHILLCHMHNSHQVWNNRILPKKELFGVWQLHALEDLYVINDDNFAHTIEILHSVPLRNQIHYKNSKGLEFINEVEDIIFHMVNHTTYHRAQIATLVRSEALEPIESDFVVYKRAGLG